MSNWYQVSGGSAVDGIYATWPSQWPQSLAWLCMVTDGSGNIYSIYRDPSLAYWTLRNNGTLQEWHLTSASLTDPTGTYSPVGFSTGSPVVALLQNVPDALTTPPNIGEGAGGLSLITTARAQQLPYLAKIAAATVTAYIKTASDILFQYCAKFATGVNLLASPLPDTLQQACAVLVQWLIQHDSLNLLMGSESVDGYAYVLRQLRPGQVLPDEVLALVQMCQSSVPPTLAHREAENVHKHLDTGVLFYNGGYFPNGFNPGCPADVDPNFGN